MWCLGGIVVEFPALSHFILESWVETLVGSRDFRTTSTSPPPPGRVPYGRKRCLAQKHRYQASRKKGWFSWHSMGEPSWFTIRIWWGRNHPRVHVQVRSYELGLKPAGHLAQSWMRHPPSHGFLSVFSNTTTWWFHGCNEKLVLWSAQCLFTADCQVGQKSGHIVLGSVVRRVMGTNTK